MSPAAPLCAAIDHLVVTAPTLESGAAYVRDMLGVAPHGGGRHPRMSTHNLLLKLGDALYLEVIAIDAAAPRPARARWFSLDTLDHDAQPRLATWVVRTRDIDAAVAACPERLGAIEPMTRGTFEWRITIPADGGLPFGGAMPTLIEWCGTAHPASTLGASGCSLVRLEARHPDAERIRRALHAIGFNDCYSARETFPGEAPQLLALIDTPHGRRTLGGA